MYADSEYTKQYYQAMILNHRTGIIIAILSFFSCRQVATAQFCPYTPYRWSVHATNPLSLLSKAGVQLQYRLSSKHSVVAGYRHYYGFFPGNQISIAYHRYFALNADDEFFVYGRGGAGDAGYIPKPYYAGAEDPYISPDKYLFVGGGVGRRYNFGHFFIEVNAGLKLAGLVENKEGYNKNLFYATGPGSFLDCGLHLGLQFFDEERGLFRHSLAPHRPRIHY